MEININIQRSKMEKGTRGGR